jgi:Fe-S-cluster containining protein
MTSGALPMDQSPCNGCTACRHRCTAGITLTRAEFDALRQHLATMDPVRRDAVLSQNKELPWPGAEGEATYTACRFFDVPTGLCSVYEARPLICRLFGHVEWLPCPIEKIDKVWSGGPARMRERANEETHTWEEWESLTGAGPWRARSEDDNHAHSS